MISIHALRKESDSTLFVGVVVEDEISIHALRKESDFTVPVVGHGAHISIHALRKESDGRAPRIRVHLTAFQSTLSVRRTTATLTRLM